jgi:Lon protease-like protein
MKLTERYPSVDALPPELPVFPLRGAILLPRSSLPLNIFEPRYLQMFDDAVGSHRLVGIIQPARESGDSESPQGNAVPLRSVGCVGRITGYQEVDDGRLLISLTGIARFSVRQEVPSHRPYRLCAVNYQPFAKDLVAGAGEELVDRDALVAALKAYLETRNLKADWAAVTRSSNETLVNSLSIMSPYGPEEKQALLEAADLRTRADVLIALAEMEIASAGRGGSGTTLQ